MPSTFDNYVAFDGVGDALLQSTVFSTFITMGWLWALALASPWSSSEWQIKLEFSSQQGSRLALPFDVLIEAEAQTHLDEFMLGSTKSDVITVLEDPTYITLAGEQTVRLGDEGGWKILGRRSGKAGDAGELRIWLDVLDDLSKNDLEINAQRIYLTANCWREEEFKIGSRRLKPISLEYEDFERQIQERLAHETGDRRLDGTNLVDTAMGSIDMGLLVTKRDNARFRFKQAEQLLPNTDSVAKGRWPGSTEPLYIAKGCIEIKETQVLSENYQKVGTWTATPVLKKQDEEEEVEVRVSEEEK